MKKIFIVAMIIPLAILSCERDEKLTPSEPQLPCITQTGEDTFGCLVNGEVWVPKGGGLLKAYSIDYNDNTILMFARRIGETKQEEEFIRMDINGTVTGEGDYGLYYVKDIIDGGDVWFSKDTMLYCPDSLNHNLTITKLDTTNRIIAGIFYFDAIYQYGSDTLQIREGRFDFNY